MEKLSGFAKKVRFSTVISGTSDSGVSTGYVASFEIDGRPIELLMPVTIMIEDGDEIIVAGKVKRGLFHALAYNNLSNGVSGKGNSIATMVAGVIFTFIGIPFCVVGIGVIFVAFGIHYFVKGKNMANAYEIVLEK